MNDLEQRTKNFALEVIRFSRSLPKTREADVIARQLLRSATSVGANYREAQRGVSRRDFKNKIGTVEKEAAETQYWLELIIGSSIQSGEEARHLHQESTELLAIFTTIGKKLRD
ncbi:MAG TPA: four helix bundle protein [Chthoniobacterales bacterium]|nr:four helix bundle protein [Chthoniobacterales bacterium]